MTMTEPTETGPEKPEKIVREHVTTLHLIGEQLSQIESWFWQHLADVREAAAPATDQAALVDLGAQAIWAQYSNAEPSRDGLVMANPHAAAAAVLAALPAPADRAAVYHEVADRLERKASARTEGMHNMAAFVAKARVAEADTLNREAAELRRMAAEARDSEQQDDGTPASTAPLASGLPLVKGNCPACRRASLFLGTGGYPTCANHECTEPDAATTVLEQYAREAHPPEHSWAAELHDPVAKEWVPGTRYLVRERAVNALDHAKRVGPAWKDGTPTDRRLVRATTTYTVEDEHTPAAEAQQDGAQS
jgi:hypothetical protein